MKIAETQNNSAVVILERKHNNGLVNAIFCGADPSSHFSVLNYSFEEKNEQWFALATSFTFQKYSHGLFNRLLIYDKSFVSEILKISNCYKNVYIFVHNDIFLVPAWYGTEFRQIKKRCPNVYFIFFYIDIVDSKYSRKANLFLKNYKDVFDLVYTSDKKDADSYNMIYWPLPYAYSHYAETINLDDQKKIELSFCANIKKRSELILKVLNGCIENNISTSMVLLPNNETEKQLFSEYEDIVTILSKFLQYDESLKYTLNSECILDIVQDGQTALSMRPYEAVVFNKKLLTNNPSVLTFKYYRQDYIQYFSQPQDIDWEWVKNKIVVDYEYQGEFSPEYLWRDIESRLL